MSTEDYVDIVKKIDDVKAGKLTFYFSPIQWRTYTQTHNWKNEKLDGEYETQIPETPGIYTLLLQPCTQNHPTCYLMYVGKTNCLRTRFKQYLKMERDINKRPHVAYFLNKYDPYVNFCYTLVPEESLDQVENSFMQAYLPPLNEQYEGEFSIIMRAAF